MKGLIVALLVLPVFLVALDQDMDGVSDKHDRCKNTPFWAMVNSRGCTVKKIKPRRR
jgi:hypothetical protein